MVRIFGRGDNRDDQWFADLAEQLKSESEEDAFMPEDDEDDENTNDMPFVEIGGDIFEKIKLIIPGPNTDRLIDALKSPEVQEKLKESLYNAGIYVMNFMSDGYALMKLTKMLHKHYPTIPVLSFGQAIAISRVLASIMRSAIYYMQLQPAKTYKDVIGS